MTEVLEPVPIVITGDKRPKAARDSIIGDGFTVVLLAGDPQGQGARQLLGADPTRMAAWIQTDTIAYIGTKQQMSGINALVNNAVAGPGARILNVSPFLLVKGQNEIWVAFTAAPTVIGVWVERRVAGGMATGGRS